MSPHPTYDAIVLGGGAAGLSAALMLGRSCRRTLVLDAASPRNRFTTHMHGALGHEGLNPAELLAKGRAETASYGVEHRIGTATEVREADEGLEVVVGGEALSTRTLVLATGASDALPAIAGLADRWGTTVLHCPYCHGWEVRDQRLGVLVTSPIQAHMPLLLRQLSAHVTVFAPGGAAIDEPSLARYAARGISVVASGLAWVGGPDGTLDHVVTDAGDMVPLDALFVGAPLIPHDEMLAGLSLDRAETPVGSFLAVDASGRTSHPRIWAAGNVVSPQANVPVSMAAGTTAGAAINGMLAHEDAETSAEWHDVAPADYWEERYATQERMWSGSVNATMADVVKDLEPGTALDLGCGEGADVRWLASQGWKAHGLDISPTAIDRARDAARAEALDGATFGVADLSTWRPDATYDLVTASFLHSPVDLPRSAILRVAAEAVAPGGRLLVVTHAAPPPWARPEHTAHHTFQGAAEELESLGLDASAWDVEIAHDRARTTTHPEHGAAVLMDGVVLVSRRA